MKRKWLALGLVLVMTAAAGCGATEDAGNDAPETAVVDEAYYSPILDEYYSLIYYDEVGVMVSSDMGVMELLASGTPEAVAKQIGYAIEDISGDDVPELLMSVIEEETDEGCFGETLLAVFHCGADAPVKTLDGWGRNRYSLLENGDVFYQGAAGAAYSIFSTSTLSADGAELICNDFYFTYEKDDTFNEIGCYHNTTGEWDKDSSEEMDITTEEFWKMEEDLSAQVKKLTLTPFTEYTPVSVPVYEVATKVTADYAENVDCAAYDVFVADDSEYAAEIAFVGEGNVKEFKVLSLFLEDVKEDGTPVFATTELYTLGTLNPEKPLVVQMTFWGDTPSYGISYVNEKGETKTFAVEMSGMDGAIVLSEIG